MLLSNNPTVPLLTLTHIDNHFSKVDKPFHWYSADRVQIHPSTLDNGSMAGALEPSTFSSAIHWDPCERNISMPNGSALSRGVWGGELSKMDGFGVRILFDVGLMR